VGVFLAQGSVGRTTLSCDDGRTWILNRSYDQEGSAEACGEVDEVVCFQAGSPCSYFHAQDELCKEMTDSCDCDHHPGADKGIVFGAERFVATWGWGPPGAVKTSQDGVDWQIVVDKVTYAGIAFGNGTFVTGARQPKVSTDGLVWTNGGPADFRNAADQVIHNARDVGFADTQGGVFVAGASSNGVGSDLLVSRDNGASWTRPAGSWECGGDFTGVAGGNDVIVVTFGDKSCRSTDGGTSFAPTSLAGAVAVLFDGTQFVAWSSTQRFTSSDGGTWTATPLVIQGLGAGRSFTPGPVARSAETGTYVSVRSGWGQWYAQQDFYRSTDGVTWEVLPAESFEASHRIRHIAFGYVDASVCE
jgi:hypothetical protein